MRSAFVEARFCVLQISSELIYDPAKRADVDLFANDMFNAVAWQLVWDASTQARAAFRNDRPRVTDAVLVDRAKAHLSSFLVVGLQDRAGLFADRLRETTGISVRLGVENGNPSRPAPGDLDAETRRRIAPWIEMDLQVYEWALERFGRP